MVVGVDDEGLLVGIFVVSQCMVLLIRMNLYTVVLHVRRVNEVDVP
jgi:hypothetical protein